MNAVNDKFSEKDYNISDEIKDTCLQSQNPTAKEHRIMEKRENNNSETNHNDNKEHSKDNVDKDVSLDGPQDGHVDEEKNDNSTKNDLVKYDEPADFEEVIPEEYTGEIIVPDVTQPEDLTDDTKEDYHFVNDEEEEMTKDSDAEETEVNTSIHEESTKSSDFGVIYENECKSDKSSSALSEELRYENSKDSEDCDLDNMPVESELVAIEDGMKETLTCSLDDSTNDEQHLNSNSNRNTADDPLNCIEIRDDDEEKFDKQTNTPQPYLESNSNDKYVEDDEVQFVETRNSPICIESDEEDTVENSKSSGNGADITAPANSTAIVAKNVTVTRTSARKSTAKPQQQAQKRTIVNKSPSTVPHIQSKSKNFSYLQTATNHRRFTSIASTQQIVDCIDLLDSSDEECTPSLYKSPQQKQQQQQQLTKTPQKRTLLAAKGNYYKSCNKNATNNSNCVPNNFSYNVKQQVKKPAPPPLPPPTPQSNFLNAVQLQPAVVSGINPPAFSALLSNKNVIIPNAFYGNPPSVRATPDTDLDRRYARWLENFLNQFCKPQFLPTHSCYVFLQRALKYKDFIRIKTLRSNMNIHDQRDQINNQLMTDLRTILLKNTKKITNYGRRFCELTCSSVQGKALTLMANSITGKVTLKTCNMDIPKASATLSVATSSSSCSTNALTRKRQVDEDEDEYTPDKSKPKSKAKIPTENNDRDSGEIGEDRKRTLRTKRTKRLDNSFSYNEDDLLAEYEIDDEEEAEKLAQAEIQRKIEQKRMEAQMQRQQQVKSFESAFIQAFAKSIDGPTSSVTAKNFANQRNTPSTSSSIRQYAAADNDAEDHLKATWIENVENEDTQIISDDDEPKEHRIYKQQQVIQFQNQQNYQTSTKPSSRLNLNSSLKINRIPKRIQDEVITNEDQNYNENNNSSVTLYWPKNVDPQMYVNGKHKDRCIICNLSCQRLVHHYVNEHRGCEVYNSRLSSLQLQQLKQGNYIFSNVSLYKNGQYQYEAYCIFCEKQSRFMLPYWYQHFTMHTGEYAYRCTGCGIRKPTRSLLTQHHAQGCPQNGSVAQDYAHDLKTMQIEARICTLCNFVQLHRSNIVKHLHRQHNIKQILPKHIQTIVLLKASTIPASLTGSTSSISSSNNVSSYDHDTYIIDDDDDSDHGSEVILDDVEKEEPNNSENHYYNYIPPYMQAAVNSGNFPFANVDAGEDLSFMICGMLDVQMNTE